MMDYTELVKALRRCDMKQGCFNANCRYSVGKYFCDMDKVHKDAAAAIEELQAQLPKWGEWEKEETGKGIFKQIIYKCSICGSYLDFDGVNAGRGDANYCPCCGVKMEVQDGQK